MTYRASGSKLACLLKTKFILWIQQRQSRRNDALSAKWLHSFVATCRVLLHCWLVLDLLPVRYFCEFLHLGYRCMSWNTMEISQFWMVFLARSFIACHSFLFFFFFTFVVHPIFHQRPVPKWFSSFLRTLSAYLFFFPLHFACLLKECTTYELQ